MEWKENFGYLPFSKCRSLFFFFFSFHFFSSPFLFIFHCINIFLVSHAKRVVQSVQYFGRANEQRAMNNEAVMHLVLYFIHFYFSCVYVWNVKKIFRAVLLNLYFILCCYLRTVAKFMHSMLCAVCV